MDNTAYALTKFKVPQVDPIQYGGVLMCRCPQCGHTAQVDKKGVIRCSACGRLFVPEYKS